MRRGWTPARWRLAALLLLLAGHGAWILAGHGSLRSWQRFVGLFTGPSQRLSNRWEAWKVARGMRVWNLRQADWEVRQLRAQAEYLQLARTQDAPRLAEADEAVRLLGLRKTLPLEMKAARVLANLRKAPFGGLVIDQGEDVGLVQDQGVLCPEGVVGRIWAVAPHQASVLPLDAYNASTGVMLARSHASGVLQGVGPGKAEIRYISNQEVVQIGEPVLTSGLDRNFPRGLLVGFVSGIHPQEVEMRLEVTLAAPLDRLQLVLILPQHPEIEPKAAENPAPPLNRGIVP